MKLSRKFVSDYIDLAEELDIKRIASDMTGVGNEYDSAGKLIEATKLVVGEIIECENHPDSDHLHVCKVDIGTEVLKIVCGAPNARKGIKVIVATPGTKLPEVTIKESVIRGVESRGMLCSIKELGLEHKFLNPEDIEGIAELGEDAKVGEDAISYLELDDEVIDFELTSNRGDLLSIIGMAYELGAIYNQKVKDIDLSYLPYDKDIKEAFRVDIQTDNCQLFLAKKVTNLTVKESPKFIKNRLIASGIRPINNIVDISNYVMLETGQPLHFYDAKRLGSKLVVRMAQQGEKLTTLDGGERILTDKDIVIATPEEAIGLAGVMGGLSTEVEADTTEIIIESAIFDSILVRKTSQKILRSEASNRFEKGLDPKRSYMAIERACHLLEKYATGSVWKGMLEYNECDMNDKLISITSKNINDVLGTNIETAEIVRVLERLGFEVKQQDDDLEVVVPSRRIDISIKEDLIEEVGRIYGINNIVGKMPTLPVKQGSYNKTTRSIRNFLVGLGLNEVLTQIFLNDQEVHKYTNDSFETVMLRDPLSIEKNALRYTMIPSLMRVFEYNKARNQKDISIFEMAKGFYLKDGNYCEDFKLGILMTGNYYLGLGKEQVVDFFVIKGVLEELLHHLGYENRYSLVCQNIPLEFHKGQSAVINVQGKDVGIIGKLHPNVCKEDVFVIEINLDKLLLNKVSRVKYKEINKYPSIKKDLAFIVDVKTGSAELTKTIKKAGGKLLSNISIFDVYQGEKVKEGMKSIAYSLTFEDNTKTLSDEEVTVIFNKIIEEVTKRHQATLRDN